MWYNMEEPKKKKKSNVFNYYILYVDIDFIKNIWI